MSDTAVEKNYCDFCGDPSEPTDTVRDAWQQTCAEDADVVTEDLGIAWSFTSPKQVELREMSCGCWRVAAPGEL